MKSKKEKDNIEGQMSLEDFLAMAKENLAVLSVAELDRAIQSLKQTQALAMKRETEERRRREKEAWERRQREEREKREAHIQEVTCMELPLDWENVFDTDVRTRGVHIESIPDALIHSLSTLGRVDIEYISSITGKNYKTVISALKGSIYQNPDTWDECFYKGWETTEEYLSGNLMRKWNSAIKANDNYDGYFKENIEAIEKALPPAVATEDIYITLGSPWVPADVIDDFIEYLFGSLTGGAYWLLEKEDYRTIHDEETGTWEIPCKFRFSYHVAARSTYGTERIDALHILEKTLNMKTIAVRDEVKNPAGSSGKVRVINRTETVAALEKQKKLIKAFRDWVWTDERRKERLKNIFESKFGCVRRRIFDGSFLNFPTMSPNIKLYPYQKDAVARIILSPNTLLAHDVGAGKTYVMVAAGQELRRMGLSGKNMYVVPNNIVSQWKKIFLSMYPDANILAIEPKNFKPQKREKMLEDIRDNDYDGIIIAYSCFEQIPLSKEYCKKSLEEKKEAITEMAKQKDKATSKLKKKKESIEKALAELEEAIDDMYDTVYFDELGIDRLFVDEAHNFKNVPFDTKADKVLGISKNGSKKCQDMMDKVHMIQKKHDGKGVVMATGTPITNSLTDAYVMQQYLQSGELGMLDLQSFDSWLGMFAEKVTDFEIDVDTSAYRMATRFSRFHNLPELTALLSSVADFHGVEGVDGVPVTDGYTDLTISKSKDLAMYLEVISGRAEAVRQRLVKRYDDNMLKITTDGRKAALDLRLIDVTYPFNYQSKVATCVENVADIYFKTTAKKSTQLIFCDTSVPKQGFNIYDELKDRLILFGLPEEQIAFIHDAETDAQREELFSKVREGEIRVLIGSTFKLGLGVNVQNKLIALHHIDVPWRPADMVQREGRILRQGNENPKVMIYRYITEGSFDAYSWQLLETKQRFIAELLSGSLSQRSGSDIEDTVLDYAEVKALAIGNPLIKERVEAANELTRYMTLQRKLVETRTRLERELLEIPGRMANQVELIQKCEKDMAFYAEWKKQQKEEEKQLTQKEEEAARKKLREQINRGVNGNILNPSETILLEHCGFKVILPANMLAERPYVYLERNGKYYVELGGTEVGNLIRIENYLENLAKQLETYKESLQKMEVREQGIRAELSKEESYADEIAHYKERLEKLDEALEVKRDE